ncbi:hypothetical protein EIK77_005247 [Talaromyces pinophilus]|nr:hypothetical protein EIK77_005247 [Talaromyces pinophilus]
MSEQAQADDTNDKDLPYIRGHIFPPEEFEQTIKCRGALIRISDPNATEPYLDLRDIKKDEVHAVPAGHEVEVIHGYVKLTRSTPS